MPRNSSTVRRSSTTYDGRITELLRKGARHWSDAEVGEAVDLSIAYFDLSWDSDGKLDDRTNQRVIDLHCSFYNRLRKAIERAPLTGPIGAKAIIRLMITEVYEGHNHERLLLKKLLTHFDRSTETTQPEEMRHAA
jgi:hypothetical protein